MVVLSEMCGSSFLRNVSKKFNTGFLQKCLPNQPSLVVSHNHFIDNGANSLQHLKNYQSLRLMGQFSHHNFDKFHLSQTRNYLTLSRSLIKNVVCCESSCDNKRCAVCSTKISVELKQRRYSVVAWRGRSSGKMISTLKHSLFDTMNQPLTVCVEGNIGSGKTTFLEHFKKYSEVCVFDEPISKWRDCQGYNLLDLMYKDPKKWSMCFQSYVQLTMLDLHTKAVEQPIKMMERSIYSAQFCFVKNLRDSGLLEEPQYSVLNEWFKFALENIPIKVDLIVYLRTDPEVAFTRTNQRGRSEENSISLEYIRSVHDLHEDWLVTKKHLLPCPVLTIDANLGLEKMVENYDVCRKNMFQKVAVANC